jgi:uncharacterized lipoprotein YddW (UPF0748 family)
MATVFNTLTKPNGQPLRNVDVSVSLSWDTSSAVFVKNDNNETIVDNTAQTKTDVDGYWEMSLTDNASLSPTTFYKIVETVSATNINTYYIEITDTATPTFWIGDITVATPAWES